MNMEQERGEPMRAWTFLTNHSHVLVCLARDPKMRLREIAAAVGITERAVQRIMGELEEGGIITRSRDGRRNRYSINPNRCLRHPLESERTVGELLDTFMPRNRGAGAPLRIGSRNL
jgi:DNA-binding transcriptional ArsR family regulator